MSNESTKESEEKISEEAKLEEYKQMITNEAIKAKH